MATKNTSPSSDNLDSEIHDIHIVPPQPVTRKEYKEVVPDISMVSDIVDQGTEPENFENNYHRAQVRSKYPHVQPKSKDDIFLQNNPLVYPSNHFLPPNINHTPYQQQLGINPGVSKIINGNTEETNAILDHVVLPVTNYLKPDCHFCVINHPAMINKAYSGQYIIPKNCASILLPMGNEQSNKAMRLISEDREVISNKTCHKCMESHVGAISNHKSDSCNHGQLSCSLNSNEPEIPQITDTRESCLFKDQRSKWNRLASLNAILEESKKCEEINGKETIDTLKYKNILCPTCFKKPCKCNSTAKECDANPHAPSIEFSSILEYLKQQDEKINSINEKVSNFLSQHATCLIEQPVQGKEFSSATESDIPYILNILEVQSDKIKELQDQINLLKSSKSKYASVKIDEPVLNKVQTKNGLHTETCNEHIHCPYSHNVMCREQRQKITKASTSTMTSFVMENNDKLFYHKEMTLVTDRRQKDEPLYLPNEHDSAITKKHLGGKNVNSSPQEGKSHKHNKNSPSLKSKQNISSNSSLDEPDYNDNQELKMTHKSSKKSKHASTRNKVSHKKNVAMEDNDVEEKNSPKMRSHSKSSKQKLRNGTSPKAVDMAKIKDLRSEKMTRQTSITSSSSDTEYDSSEERLKDDKTELNYEESTTVSKYGLSSENLSIATKRYLDNYGLRRT